MVNHKTKGKIRKNFALQIQRLVVASAGFFKTLKTKNGHHCTVMKKPFFFP